VPSGEHYFMAHHVGMAEHADELAEAIEVRSIRSTLAEPLAGTPAPPGAG
jgi:hypothetical protein